MIRSARRSPRRRVRVQPVVVLWLTLIWVLLQGEFTAGNIIAGAAVAVGVSLAFPLPPLAGGLRLRPVAFLALVGRFLADLVVSNVQVGRLAYRPGPLPRSTVLGVRLCCSDALLMTVTAELLSLVPGSVMVELRAEQRMLYLHTLDAERPGAADRARRSVRRLEARVVRALGGPAALAELEAGADRPDASSTTNPTGEDDGT